MAKGRGKIGAEMDSSNSGFSGGRQNILGLASLFHWKAVMWPAIKRNFWPALFAIFIFGPVFWWTIDRTPAVVILGSNPIPNPARLNDVVDFQWNIKVLRQGCVSTFQRYSEDATGRVRTFAPMRSGFTSLPLGGHTMSTTNPFEIVPGTSTGVLRVTLVLDQVCNPIHHLWPIREISPWALIMVEK